MAVGFPLQLKQLFSVHPVLIKIFLARIMVYYPVIFPVLEVIKLNKYNTTTLSIIFTIYFLLAPFIFFFFARRSRKPFKFEKRFNCNFEALVISIGLPLLKFNPLIAFLYISNVGIGAALGGIKLVVTRVISSLMGIAIGILAFGFTINSEITLSLVVYTGISFAINTFTTGYFTYRTAIQISETKKLLKTAHQKTTIALEERSIAYQQLNKELSDAAEYVKDIIPDPITSGPVLVKWKFIPSTSLGGDGIGYRWVDHDHFAFYLIDVSGHGVGASLLAVSVLNSVRMQSLPGVNYLIPSEVLDALNRSYPSEKHNGMFFTMWYGVYNIKNRELLYSTAGHPPGFYLADINTGHTKIKELRTPNIVVGAIPDAIFKQEIEIINKDTALLIFSDGVFEFQKENGDMWSLKEFKDTSCKLINMDNDVLDKLLNCARDINNGESFDDDYTMLLIAF